MAAFRSTSLRVFSNRTAYITAFRNKCDHIRNNILKSPYKDIPRLNLTVPEFYWQNLDRWPDKTATVCAVTGHGYTYAQTHKMSTIFAASLRTKLKLRDNDTVALVLPNIPEYPCALLGTLQAGCIASTMNPAYTAYEYEHLIPMVNTKAIVTSKLSYPNITSALKKLKLDIPIVLTDADEMPAGTIKYAELAEDVHVNFDCLKSVRRSPKDIAMIPFSSGTTGFPKGVVLEHGSVVALIQMLSDPELVAIRETTEHYQAVIPAVLPFFHIFCLNVVMLSQMYLGCKLVTMPSFKPELFINTIAKHRAAALFIVPPMALFLGKHPAVTSAHMESVESIICGAAPLSANDAQLVLDKNHKINFRQGYGMTETNSTISISKNNIHNLTTVGYPISTTEVKITDVETKKTLAPGEEGEIWYRGRNLMRCYLNNEEATKEILTDDGWLRTGDIGKFDDDGYLYVTDRLKELIKVKGFQVPPAELEAIFRTHPKVIDCGVVGIKDPFLGEAPKAFIVKQPGQEISEEELKEFVNSKLINYKQVKAIQFVDSIPKNASGKILRKNLIEKYT